MNQPSIELREYQDSLPVWLDLDELAAIRRLVPGIGVRASGVELNEFVLNPGGVVGVGEIGERQLVVHPKLEIQRLLFLVSYSIAPTRWRETLRGFRGAEDLFASVIPGFVNAVFRATERGILRGYHPRAEPLTTVRGRIDFDQLIKRRFGVVPPIDCRYDEYSEDVVENQLILAAAERLMSLRRAGPRLRAQLRSIRALFGGVSRRRFVASSVPTVRYTRLTEHYRPAVELASLVLRNFSLEIGHGAVSARGFFVDTAKLFEDFVVIALREALGLSLRAFPQGSRDHRLYLDDGCRVRLEPDLSWWEEGRCVFVGDAKYKRTPAISGVKNPDLYQLFAYAQATGLSRGMLVYAAGEAPETSYRIAHSEKLLEVHTLDLDQDPQQLLIQVGELAGRIAVMRTESPPATLMPAAA